MTYSRTEMRRQQTDLYSATIHGAFLPKKFFATSGYAASSVSPLNAFDGALEQAGIAQSNLVMVSSILPPDAELIQPQKITPGTITFAVLARMDGDPGETIGAGIGWAYGVSPDGDRYGIVTEAHGYKDKLAIGKEMEWKLEEMARIRHLKLGDIKLESEFCEVPKGKYGSVVAAIVYLPWIEEESRRKPEVKKVI